MTARIARREGTNRGGKQWQDIHEKVTEGHDIWVMTTGTEQPRQVVLDWST
jgi:hypothetical protein